MDTHIIYSDAVKLAEMIRNKQVSPIEVVKAFLDRIEAVDPKVNAIVTVAKGALEAARKAEAAVMKGEKLGPLHGVPFTVKDSIDTVGVLTQRGSPIFKGRVPDTDATTVARMKHAGGIMLAKTNLPEFSYSTESDNLLTGRSNNPWDLDRTPGGSSGGESAAIAAGMSPLGLGSDVAISLRGPAAMTGIAALKATHGRIPTTGLWPRVPHRFWHVGPMARSVRDIALAYQVLAGPDGTDGYSNSPLSLDAGIRATHNRPFRVGVLVESRFTEFNRDVIATVQAAAAALKDAGVSIEPVGIPVLDEIDALDVFWKLQEMEVKPEFLKATMGHEEQIFKYVQAVYDTPNTTMSDFVAAEQQAERLRDGFANYFQRFDALLCPVTPIPAYAHGAVEFTIEGRTVPAREIMRLTVPFNIIGLPALSMRFGTSSQGLPINVQLVANHLAESTVLNLASLLEDLSQMKDLHPKL
ncbi:amidase [Agrobacterium vitis]|uniref:amidase n=1 Tax=Allorhizobium ampelinum TaxID=3025782 RepID=UPI001F338A74|nr:amidase [Allorhizobium ampelinum]MCF1464583.1 amidase [Allorhizobium ampelinum]